MIVKVNLDQVCIQVVFDVCGVLVDVEVGVIIVVVDVIVMVVQIVVVVFNVNIVGVIGEEFVKLQYCVFKFVVCFVVNLSGLGNVFISGLLILFFGVMFWIDKGVMLYVLCDVMVYLFNVVGLYCGNMVVSVIKVGSFSNCMVLIIGMNIVNFVVVGDGWIDGCGYVEIVMLNVKYLLMKVDLICLNIYVVYKIGIVVVDGMFCDNGGMVVDLKLLVCNMMWWDLVYFGNMVDNGMMGVGLQLNF